MPTCTHQDPRFLETSEAPRLCLLVDTEPLRNPSRMMRRKRTVCSRLHGAQDGLCPWLFECQTFGNCACSVRLEKHRNRINGDELCNQIRYPRRDRFDEPEKERWAIDRPRGKAVRRHNGANRCASFQSVPSSDDTACGSDGSVEATSMAATTMAPPRGSFQPNGSRPSHTDKAAAITGS